MAVTEEEKQMHRDALISGEGKMLVEYEPRKITREEFDLAMEKSIKLRKLAKQFDTVQTKIDRIKKQKTTQTHPDFFKFSVRAKHLENKMKREAFLVTKNLESLNEKKIST